MKKIVALLLTTLLLVGLCFALASCGECEHTYGDPSIKAPTCTVDGEYTYTCTKCGETKVEAPAADDTEMLKTGHTEDEGTVITAATCTTDGLKEYTCVDCGETTREVTLEASGHLSDAGVVTTLPSCTEAGVRTFTCVNLNCGAVIGTEAEPALGHSIDATAWATDGTNHYNVCALCEGTFNSAACTFAVGAVDQDKHVTACTVCLSTKGEAANHEFGAEQTVPASTTTCQAGKTYKVCAACEYELVIAVLPGVGEHVYAFDAEATELEELDHSESSHGMTLGTLVYSCTGCDDAYTISADAVVPFDDACACGFQYDAGDRASKSGDIAISRENGELSFLGAINAKIDTNGDGVNNIADNLDMRVFGSGSPMADYEGTVYCGFDIKQQPGGFPEWGVQTIFKFNGAWVNPSLIIQGGVITFNGASLSLDTTKYNNIVIRIAATEGSVSYDIWVNGVQLGTTEVKANAAITSSFSGATTYGGLKVDANGGTNVDPNRGMIFDNFFWTADAPSFVEAE